MKKNINKHDLIDKLADPGNTIDNKNRISKKFSDHFINVEKKSLKKLQRI